MPTAQDTQLTILPSSQTWQQQLANTLNSAQELLDALGIPPDALPFSQQALADFPMRVPHAFVKRMERGNLNDPLLRQVWPDIEEANTPPKGFVLDPLGEASSNPAPGIVHKYKRRVLLIVNGSCAVHCRYCFRRHFPYNDNRLSRQEWQDALEYVRSREDINEVILSGGDPLSSNDARLFELISAIEDIPHVTRLRIHSRLPIVIPARITPALIERLQLSRLNIIMVVHANHANEIDEEVGDTFVRMRAAGIHVLNQSVLLKNINDDAQSLIDLSERLFEFGAMPYYLHLLDPVVGAHHFDISESRATTLMADVQTQLPGFLVPKLVREVDGRPSKTLIPLTSREF